MIDKITEQPFRQTRISGSTFVNADCFDVFPFIEDKSIDAIICDLPYGTTACKWDTIIPFEPLWEQYERIIKDNGAIVLTASQPFTTVLINSNLEAFRYCWVWNKKKAGNIFLAKKQPMKIHEDVVVFSKKPHNYYPQMIKRDKVKRSKNYGTGEAIGGTKEKENKVYTYTHKYPTSILEFSNAVQKGKVHPTQKPVALFEYLIKTYTNEGETVLDNCMGSGTTGVACKNLNRNFIGIELDEGYFKIAKERIGVE
jgi:site-specific DNA-methyltransferase (adenine-specific)